MKGLQDKAALVTGGSSGIGQAIAIRLGEEGARVAINYVGLPEGAVTTREAIEYGVEMCVKKVAEAGGRPILVEADASDEQAVGAMYDRVMGEYGRLDILVNNAGIQVAAHPTRRTGSSASWPTRQRLSCSAGWTCRSCSGSAASATCPSGSCRTWPGGGQPAGAGGQRRVDPAAAGRVRRAARRRAAADRAAG